MNRRMLGVCLGTCFALVAVGAARGEEVGVSEHTILIGRLTPRGSPNFAGMAKQRTEGADAYIASINAAGGVHGRRIVLKDRDDAYERERARREIKALIEEDKVFALLGAFGSPTLPVVMTQAYKRSLAQAKVEPVAVIEFGVKDDPAAIARRLLAARPQALLISALPKPFAAVYKQYLALGGSARVFGMSAIRIEDLQSELGPQAKGVVLSQASPVPTRISVPLVEEFNKTLSRHANGTAPSYHGRDGYLEARVLVEALKRAGPALTRAKLVAALEQFSNRDFGGVTVRYGPNDRTGSSFVDLVMLGSRQIVY
jgi:ABC-type branched-subunit amino acid transport system substrate-binding protein